MTYSNETLMNRKIKANYLPGLEKWISNQLDIIESTYINIEAGMDNADSLAQRGQITTWSEYFETIRMTMESLDD